MSRVGAFDPNRSGANLNPLNALIPIPPNKLEEASYSWATVTQVSPSILVRLDTEPVAIGSPASTLVPITVGDRVYVQFYQRRVLILGNRLFDPTPPDPPEPVGIYTSFTPTMAVGNGTGAQPTWGNSIRTGRHTRIGDQVSLQAYIEIGSTFSAGLATSTWSMPLPIPANTVAQGLMQLYVVCGTWFSGETSGFSRLEDPDNLLRIWVDNSGNYQTLRGDRGWATGNRIIVTGTYEAAP